ncbi:MAG: ribonuclease HII [Archaeoglobales archaeon]|nr:ribonuclease HII [Archaeoglobales archaeon]
MIAGIDEAGKGCVIGPLVVAGVCATSNSIFESLGVKDSKKLSHKRRLELAEEIHKVARIEVVKVEAEKLDELMNFKTINEVLKDCYAELINRLKPEKVYLDSPDVIPERLAIELKRSCGVEVEAAHKAEDKFASVAAASIIAKVEREKEIENMKKTFGDFGSGYSSDPKTREYLKACISKGFLPPIVRKKWKTVSNISQLTLEDF